MWRHRRQLPLMVRDNFKTCSEIPPPSSAMAKGHLDQQRRNTATTQPIPPRIIMLPDKNSATIPEPDASRPISKTHALEAFCILSNGRIFTNQTEHMPIQSTFGSGNLLILYDYESNIIHTEPMPSCTGYQILLAYQHAHKLLTSRGLKQKW